MDRDAPHSQELCQHLLQKGTGLYRSILKEYKQLLVNLHEGANDFPHMEPLLHETEVLKILHGFEMIQVTLNKARQQFVLLNDFERDEKKTAHDDSLRKAQAAVDAMGQGVRDLRDEGELLLARCESAVGAK